MIGRALRDDRDPGVLTLRIAWPPFIIASPVSLYGERAALSRFADIADSRKSGSLVYSHPHQRALFELAFGHDLTQPFSSRLRIFGGPSGEFPSIEIHLSCNNLR